MPGGDEIAPQINELAASEEFDLVVATRDWHPPDHGSFREQGGPWQPHCVAGSHGAELHPALQRARIDVVVDAGRDRDAEGYSGFEDTDLEQILRERGVEEVAICGLATDYCVKHTALDALRAGFRVCVEEGAIRGIDVEPGDSRRALDELRQAGAIVR